MIEFSIVNVFEHSYFNGLYIFVENEDETGVVDWVERCWSVGKINTSVGRYQKYGK